MRIVDMLIAASLGLAASSARAGDPVQPRRAAIVDNAQVQAFLDAYLPNAMASRHIPGLVITVVAGGAPIVTKGYGVANIETRRPVDPARTLFDVESVS